MRLKRCAGNAGDFLDCVDDNCLMLLAGRNRNNSLLDLLLMKTEESKLVINNSRDQSDHELAQFVMQRNPGKLDSKL